MQKLQMTRNTKKLEYLDPLSEDGRRAGKILLDVLNKLGSEVEPDELTDWIKRRRDYLDFYTLIVLELGDAQIHKANLSPDKFDELRYFFWGTVPCYMDTIANNRSP